MIIKKYIFTKKHDLGIISLNTALNYFLDKKNTYHCIFRTINWNESEYNTIYLLEC